MRNLAVSLESMGAVRFVEFPTALCFRPDDEDEEYITSKTIQRQEMGLTSLQGCQASRFECDSHAI